jgi:hypothetical protein
LPAQATTLTVMLPLCGWPIALRNFLAKKAPFDSGARKVTLWKTMPP